MALGRHLGYDVHRNTLGVLDMTRERSLVPLIAMTRAVGPFQAVFFRGWLRFRFEGGFGIVPRLLLGATSQSLYLLAYGMTAQELATPWTGLKRLTRRAESQPRAAAQGCRLLRSQTPGLSHLGWDIRH